MDLTISWTIFEQKQQQIITLLVPLREFSKKFRGCMIKQTSGTLNLRCGHTLPLERLYYLPLWSQMVQTDENQESTSRIPMSVNIHCRHCKIFWFGNAPKNLEYMCTSVSIFWFRKWRGNMELFNNFGSKNLQKSTGFLSNFWYGKLWWVQACKPFQLCHIKKC